MAAWDELGGDAVMEPLLADFYARIAASPIARLFPPDLDETRRKQFAFQSEFWGGPARYSPWRGHPRLRARHLPFPIGMAEADTWLACMRAAVDASAMPDAARAAYMDQMRKTAYAMINQPVDGF
ncbi:MAG TPA: globin [Planctomycetota bacterium]|nr:globin [Planctomycetota bacterium]